MNLTERQIVRKLGLKPDEGSHINCHKSWYLDEYTILIMLKEPFADGNRFEIKFEDSREGRYLSINTLYELSEACSILQIDLPNAILYEKAYCRKKR